MQAQGHPKCTKYHLQAKWIQRTLVFQCLWQTKPHVHKNITEFTISLCHFASSQATDIESTSHKRMGSIKLSAFPRGPCSTSMEKPPVASNSFLPHFWEGENSQGSQCPNKVGVKTPQSHHSCLNMPYSSATSVKTRHPIFEFPVLTLLNVDVHIRARSYTQVHLKGRSILAPCSKDQAYIKGKGYST